MNSKGVAVQDRAPGGRFRAGAQPRQAQQEPQQECEQEDGSVHAVNLADNINFPHLFLWNTPIIQRLLTAFRPTLQAPETLSCSSSRFSFSTPAFAH